MTSLHVTLTIQALVERVQADERSIGVLSTGETIVVALVLDRKDLLPDGLTVLQAIDRLGPDWTHAALAVQRSLRS